jgi:hypothetical protein
VHCAGISGKAMYLIQPPREKVCKWPAFERADEGHSEGEAGESGSSGEAEFFVWRKLLG